MNPCYQCQEIADLYNQGTILPRTETRWAATCPVCQETHGVRLPLPENRGA